VSGVFSGDQIDTFQHLDRAKCDIAQISDRRRNHVKHSNLGENQNV